MGFVRAFGLVLLLSAGLSAGCNTAPTLPLPPPVASVAKPDMQGFALVEGEVNENAYVYVFNEVLHAVPLAITLRARPLKGIARADSRASLLRFAANR